MIVKEKALSLFQQMLYARRFEETVVDLWESVPCETHKHLYIGQEAVGAGVVAHLRVDDKLTTTHRNHGHVALRGAEPGKALAEILGRADGYNSGRSGSSGITASEVGFLFTTAQVGGGTGLATGAALAQRIQQKGGISVAFFGDGALEEGISFESMNLAALHKLPILYVCENNSVGVTTGRANNEWSSSSMAADTLGDIPRSLGIKTEIVSGEDVEGIYETVAKLVSELRSGETGPAFIEMRSQRWPGSRSFNPTLIYGETKLEWILEPSSVTGEHADYINQYDPVVVYGRTLMDRPQHLDALSLAVMDEEVRSKLAAAKEFALSSPEPSPDDSYVGTFAESGSAL